MKTETEAEFLIRKILGIYSRSSALKIVTKFSGVVPVLQVMSEITEVTIQSPNIPIQNEIEKLCYVCHA